MEGKGGFLGRLEGWELYVFLFRRKEKWFLTKGRESGGEFIGFVDCLFFVFCSWGLVMSDSFRL